MSDDVSPEALSAKINGLQVPVYMAGLTQDGFQRWVINNPVLNGDDVELWPWPPPSPTVILNYVEGRHRTMFQFRPGKDVVIPYRMLNWDWDLSPVCEPEAIRVARTDRSEDRLHPFEEELAKRGMELTPEGIRLAKDESLVAGRDALVEAIRGIDDEIVLWWINQALQEAQQTVKKAREYGSTELRYAGHVLASLGGREVSDAEAIELQCLQYCLGKLGRWIAAARRHEQVSDDSLYDLGVYVRMVQFTREHGTWVE